MSKQSEFIDSIAEKTGAALKLGENGICDMVVDDVVITVQYRDAADEWLMLATVTDAGEADLPAHVPAAALRHSLFGTKTFGFVPGIFANAVLLSGTVRATEVDADSFLDRVILLAKAVKDMAEVLNAPDGGTGEKTSDLGVTSGDVIRI